MNNQIVSQSETEIDDTVASQADEDSMWEAPVRVNRTANAKFPLPAEIAARASFVARLHGVKVDEWLMRVIEERVRFEESAFAEIKRDITEQHPRR